jgi:hypothetical protein
MPRTPYLRVVPVVLAAALSALALSGTASAAPPLPGVTPVTIADAPAGEFCSFPVLVQAQDGQKAHTTGVVLLTGPFVAIVTNKATGAKLTLNASGPTLTNRSNGHLVVVGPSLIGQPASRNVGPAFLILNSGRVEFTDNFTIATRSGKVRDICAELSAV